MEEEFIFMKEELNVETQRQVCRKRSLEACSKRLKAEDVAERTNVCWNHTVLGRTESS
jgi:hypothetical protein